MTIDSNIYNFTAASNCEVDSISANIIHPETPKVTGSTNDRTIEKLPVSKKILIGIGSFLSKLINLAERIISIIERATNYIDNKWNALVDAIKQIKADIQNNHLSFKIANFKLSINKPVYNINIYY